MILEKLKNEKERLSRTERKIAELLLADPDAFVRMSAIELSRRAGVSQGSINNFSRKLAGGGFSELKVRVSIESTQTTRFDAVREGEGVSDILHNSTAEIVDAFRRTESLNDEATLTRAAELIIGARHVQLYGIFRSGTAAQDLAYQLMQFGFSVDCVTDGVLSAISASTLAPDSVIVAISASGKTRDIYTTIKIAKDRGVPSILITRNKNSAIAKMCDVVLLVAGDQGALSRRTDVTRMCIHYLADALCAYLRHRLPENGKQRYYGLRELLGAHVIEE